MIFVYIQIFWTNIFVCQNIWWIFLEQIYLDILSWSFFPEQYILRFIRPISIVTNIFRYSFVQTNHICPTLNQMGFYLVLPLFICFLNGSLLRKQELSFCVRVLISLKYFWHSLLKKLNASFLDGFWTLNFKFTSIFTLAWSVSVTFPLWRMPWKFVSWYSPISSSYILTT